MHRYTSPRLSFLTIAKWQFSKSLRKKEPVVSTLPIISHNELPKGEYALWIGHASVWINMKNTIVAIDPVLGDIPLYRRHTPLPVPKEKLYADVILITHAHYDHFDRASVDYLLKQNPDTIIVAPNGFWRYMKGKIDRERCFELEWWESLMVKGLFITLTPSKHWSKRTPFDTNKALWGGYVIQNTQRTVYHAGDSAYGEHFKEIGERFDIDEAFLPIGAYRPEEIMKHNHLNPPEALHAAEDLEAKTVVPIHYGTFILSDEPINEPIEWFEKLVHTHVCPFDTRALNIGEIYRFKETPTSGSL